MKAYFAIAFFLLLTLSSAGQIINPNYDSTLAMNLGADEYGMKTYVLVILKTGSNNVEPGAKRDSLFTGHFNNIKKMTGLKKLIVAGPMSDNEKSYSGIFILDVKTFEEARTLLDKYPTIKEKVFNPELYQWYGSAALSEYLKISDRIWKINPF